MDRPEAKVEAKAKRTIFFEEDGWRDIDVGTFEKEGEDLEVVGGYYIKDKNEATAVAFAVTEPEPTSSALGSKRAGDNGNDDYYGVAAAGPAAVNSDDEYDPPDTDDDTRTPELAELSANFVTSFIKAIAEIETEDEVKRKAAEEKRKERVSRRETFELEEGNLFFFGSSPLRTGNFTEGFKNIQRQAPMRAKTRLSTGAISRVSYGRPAKTSEAAATSSAPVALPLTPKKKGTVSVTPLSKKPPKLTLKGKLQPKVTPRLRGRPRKSQSVSRANPNQTRRGVPTTSSDKDLSSEEEVEEEIPWDVGRASPSSNEYYIEKVLNHRLDVDKMTEFPTRVAFQYLVKWWRWPDKYNEWVPESGMSVCSVKSYWKYTARKLRRGGLRKNAKSKYTNRTFENEPKDASMGDFLDDFVTRELKKMEDLKKKFDKFPSSSDVKKKLHNLK